MERSWCIVCLSALLLFATAYLHQKRFDAPTPVSRLDLLHALMRGTICIDNYHTNTPDKAVFNGHYYSDKAPGTAALALPAFAGAAGLLRAVGVPLDSRPGWLISSWAGCVGSIGIMTALGGTALFAWLSRHVCSRWALLTTLALFLGAAPLPYSTMMFSHALVIALIAVAAWAIQGVSECGGSPGQPGMVPWFNANGRALLAGFACGWALASEYSAGIVIVGLFVWLLSVRWRHLIPFCSAAIPPLLLIPAYNWACFGDPLILPYSQQASFSAMEEGLYAIKWPDAETAFNLLFSPARGLLFWTPLLVMAGLGYWELCRVSQTMAWLTYLVPVVQIVVISGRTWDWQAGPTLGPRLLAPVIPMLALPCAYGVKAFPKIGTTLAIYSILITTLATLTDACPPSDNHPNPLWDFHLPLLLKGRFSPNLGMVLGLPPYASVALYYAVLIGVIVWVWRRLPAGSIRSVHSGRGEQPDPL